MSSFYGNGGGSSQSGAGGDVLAEKMYICGVEEYDAVTGLPSIENPEEGMFYLVPLVGEDENNLFNEFIYKNGNWEKFGSGGVSVNFDETPTAGSSNAVTSGGLNDYIMVVPGIGTGSAKMKGNSVASGVLAFAEGYNTIASGNYSHAEGGSTTASRMYSHAEGGSTTASGNYSHAEGQGGTFTLNNVLYTSGAKDQASHSEGYQTVAESTADHTEGYQTRTSISQPGNHAEGYRTAALGGASHAEGQSTTASGPQSHAEGNNTTASGNYSHAEGANTIASGYQSHAEGYQTTASGPSSHAEGANTTAYGSYTHAEGANTTASGNNSHAEGGNTTASSLCAHAEGAGTTASGVNSHAEGGGTIASGSQSHAEGGGTTANHKSQHVFGEFNVLDDSIAAVTARGTYVEIVGNGDSNTRSNARTLDWSGNEVLAGKLTVGAQPIENMDVATKQYVDEHNSSGGLQNLVDGSATGSVRGINSAIEDNSYTIGVNAVAEGAATKASGNYSHAEGGGTTASGAGSHTEGSGTTASGSQSHAEGNMTTASNSNSHAEGQNTTASGVMSHAEGNNTIASGQHSHAEGNNAKATGKCSHAEGSGGTFTLNNDQYTSGAKSTASHSEGYQTVAEGMADHTEGYQTRTSSSGQSGKHAEGYQTAAIGGASHAEGNNTIASGNQSHTEGSDTAASGGQSHAEGYNTIASSNQSHAEGAWTIASGDQSHAEGSGTVANHRSQHVFGEYNVEDSSTAQPAARGNYVEIVGNGTSSSTRSNARTLDWNGNETLAGTLTVANDPVNNLDVATKQYVDTNSLTSAAKLALLNCFKYVAWIDENGKNYYNALKTALGVSEESQGWDYEWSVEDETVPDGMSYQSFSWSEEPGALLVFSSNLNFNCVGDCEIEIECKWHAVSGSTTMQNPQIVICTATSANGNSGAKIFGNPTSGRNVQTSVSGSTVDTGISGDVYHVYNFKSVGGQLTLTVDGNQVATGTGVSNSQYIPYTGIAGNSVSGCGLFFKSIKFKEL